MSTCVDNPADQRLSRLSGTTSPGNPVPGAGRRWVAPGTEFPGTPGPGDQKKVNGPVWNDFPRESRRRSWSTMSSPWDGIPGDARSRGPKKSKWYCLLDTPFPRTCHPGWLKQVSSKQSPHQEQQATDRVTPRATSNLDGLSSKPQTG